MFPVLSADAIDEVERLYDEGLLVQAYEVIRPLGPLHKTPGTWPRIMVGLLAANIGSPGLAQFLFRQAHRDDPADPSARYYAARSVFERRGPYVALQFLRSLGAAPWGRGEFREAPGHVEADFLSMEAHFVALLRDFSRADELIRQALALDPEIPWLHVEQASILQYQDRYDEAIAASRHALSLHAMFRPALQGLAHLLTLVGRDDEALAVLTEGAEKLESAPVVSQLVYLQQELGLHAEARTYLDRIPKLAPLANRGFNRWYHSARANACYYCGDFPEAAQYARKLTKNKFYESFARRLETAAPGGQRVRLPVSFTRQHRLTCVPACLTMLCRFWNKPAEHLDIVRSICYDGTPPHAERRWAMDHGFAVREFTLSWETALALLNRGIPFILTTVDATRGHAQIVMGYDTIRNTLLIRDPYSRAMQEFDAPATLEYFRASGPRALLLVPVDQQHLLAEIAADFPGDLPDAALYDHLFTLQSALASHQRSAAQTAWEQLLAQAPGHRITLYAQRCLAVYDGHTPGVLGATDALLKLFPDDAALQLTRYQCMRTLAARQGRLDYLEALCAKPVTHPALRQQLANELLDDARQHERVTELMRRLLRRAPFEAENYVGLGHTHWTKRRIAEAIELYRIAGCLEDKDERYARIYFSASGAVRGTDEAMTFLRERFARAGQTSSLPARTLFGALEAVERTDEAFAVLATALERRPEDPELLLFAAGAHARYGHQEEFRDLLARAEGKAHPIGWLVTAAQAATIRCDHAEALGYWNRVLAADPLNLDAQRAVADLLARTESRAAGLAQLRASAAKFPYQIPLHQLFVTWLRQEDSVEAEVAIRHLLDVDALNAWAHRELAWNLTAQRRLDEALAAAQTAEHLAPHVSTTFTTLAHVHSRAGRTAEARAALRHALELTIDDPASLSMFMEQCDTTVERWQALAFIQEQLVAQVITGDGLLAFRRHAAATLPPEEVEARLREALAARPDLWHAHSAVGAQLLRMNRAEEALAIVTQATARFSLVPRLWCDLAEIHDARHDVPSQREALRRALAINPAWSFPARQLAGTYENDGELPQAIEIVRNACARDPLDASNHGYLAHLLHKSGQGTEAMAAQEHALSLQPFNNNAWNVLTQWAKELKQPDLVPQKARELTQRRAGDAAVWILLARVLPDSDLPEALSAVQKAIELEPRNFEAHDVHATVLASQRRFDEALAACQPAVFEHHPPAPLRARAAWIHAQAGRLDRAITDMSAVLAVDQTNFWAWRQLADWYRQQGAYKDYLRIAQQMTKLWPQNAANHEYVADAFLCCGDQAAGKAALLGALELEPTSRYALDTLFDVQIRSSDFEGAAKMLEVYRRHYAGDTANQRELRLATQRKNLDGVVAALRSLAASPTLAAREVREACELLAKEPERRKELIARLDPLVRQRPADSAPPPNAALALVKLYLFASDFEHCEELLSSLPADSPAFLKSVPDYLEKVAKAKDLGRYRKFVSRYAAALRADTYVWSFAGWCYGVLDQHAEVISWLRDYAARPRLTPWPLLNLANAYRELGRDVEAHKVSEDALKLPRDSNSPQHEMFLATDDLLYPRVGGPRIQNYSVALAAVARWQRVLGAIKIADISKYYQCLHHLLQIPLAQGTPGGLALPALRKHLQDAERVFPTYRSDSILRRYYRRTLTQTIRRRNRLSVRLHAAYRLLKSFKS